MTDPAGIPALVNAIRRMHWTVLALSRGRVDGSALAALANEAQSVGAFEP